MGGDRTAENDVRTHDAARVSVQLSSGTPVHAGTVQAATVQVRTVQAAIDAGPHSREPDSTGPHQVGPHSTKRTHVQTADTVHSRHEAGYACDIHWTRIAEASGVQRPEQRQKKQNAFETVMPRAWPVKMLGLLLAIVAVVLMSEILSVLLNLPEDNVGVLRRFK